MKEELLRLLVNMSPSEVERLKNKKSGACSATNGPSRSKEKAAKIVIQETAEGDEDEDDEDSDSGETMSQGTTIIVRSRLYYQFYQKDTIYFFLVFLTWRYT